MKDNAQFSITLARGPGLRRLRLLRHLWTVFAKLLVNSYWILIPSKKHHGDPKFHILPLIPGVVSPLSLQLEMVYREKQQDAK